MLETTPVRILGETGDARLVFYEGALVALILCLSDEYDGDAGRWHLEWGHNGLAALEHCTFDTLSEAEGSVLRALRA
jgi:hypothetical protein